MKNQEDIEPEISQQDFEDVKKRGKIWDKLAGGSRQECLSVRPNEAINLRVKSPDEQLLIKTPWCSIYTTKLIGISKEKQKEIAEFVAQDVKMTLMEAEMQTCRALVANDPIELTEFVDGIEKILTDNPNSWTYVRSKK